MGALGSGSRSVALALGLALALTGPRARADAEACARAYERAQSLRQDTKLIDARKALLTCAQDSCPTVLRKDCVGWLSEVSAEIPALSVRVHGQDGCDHPEAQITLDGLLVPRAAEGRPIDVDPGSHTIGAVLAGASTEQVVVATAADRRRVVTLELGDPRASCANLATSTLVTPKEAPPDSRSNEKRRPTTLTYALGTIGLVSGAVSIPFGISAWSQKGTLDDCKGSCAQRDVDTMRRTFLIADVSMVVAIASLTAAVVLYLTR